MTSVAVLFRGISYSRPHQHCRPWGIDWRLAYPSQVKYLLEPLGKLYGRVDVYLTTYRHQYDVELYRDYNPVATCGNDAVHGTQKSTALHGLTYIDLNPLKYQTVVVTRFDMELLCDVTRLPWKDDCINFLWRETEHGWEDSNRVADCLHWLSGDLLSAFITGIKRSSSEYCLHEIWQPLLNDVPRDRLNYIIDDFGWSNPWDYPNGIYTFRRVHE